MPMILHGVERSPPCRSVLVVGKALDLDIEVKTVDLFGKKEHKSEDFLKMNPAHTVPTLNDNGFYVWESRAIMGYLVHCYGKDDTFYPKEVKQRAAVDSILYFDSGSLYTSIWEYYVFTNDPPHVAKEATLKDRLATLERILTQRPYTAGEQVTIADISVVTSLSVPPAFGFTYDDDYPRLKEYIGRVKTELPFYNEVCQPGERQFAIFLDQMMQKKKQN